MSFGQIIQAPRAIRTEHSCVFLSEYVHDLNIDFWPENLLQTEEIERFREFEDPKAKASYLKSHVALREILSGELACEPAKIRFAYPPSGKPTLISPSIGNFHFSLSRSHEVACVGVSRIGSIGVDVEVERSAVAYQKVYSTALSRKELHWLLSQPKHSRDSEFLRLWTAKEATLKASSIGLAIAPNTVCTDPARQTTTETPTRVAANGKSYHVNYHRFGKVHVSVAMQSDAICDTPGEDWNDYGS